MTFNEYQQLAARTANTKLPVSTRRVVAGLGLTGEAGETAELIKKEVGHGIPLSADAIRKELGDVLWYVAELATVYDLTLDEIAEVNIGKLRARYPQGFVEGGGIR